MVFANDDWTGNKTDRKSNTDCILLLSESLIGWISKNNRAWHCNQLIWNMYPLHKQLNNYSAGQFTRYRYVIVYLKINRAVLKIMQRPKYTSGTKCEGNKYHVIRSLREKGIIDLTCQHTRGMIVNIMTKHLPKPDFIKHKLKLL